MFHLMNRIDTREDKYEIAMKISIDDGIEKIISLAEEYDGVIIGDISAGFRNQLVKLCYANNIRSYTVPKISDILLRSSVEMNIFDSPLYLSRNFDGLALDQAFVKRAMDIVIASLMLVVSSPFCGNRSFNKRHGSWTGILYTKATDKRRKDIFYI